MLLHTPAQQQQQQQQQQLTTVYVMATPSSTMSWKGSSTALPFFLPST
jgi:hypothetical protein